MTSIRLAVLLVPTLLALWVGIIRPDLRRLMFWGGLLAVPVLVTSPLTFHFLDFPIGLIRLVALFAFGAIAAASYEVIFHKHFQLHKRSRRPLLLMLLGPLIFLVGVMTFSQTALPIVLTLFLEIVLVLVFRRDLIWDVLFSGTAMALFYASMLVVLIRWLELPVVENWLVQPNLSGIDFLGIPIEEIILVALFGALWGPMYPAFKDLRYKA